MRFVEWLKNLTPRTYFAATGVVGFVLLAVGAGIALGLAYFVVVFGLLLISVAYHGLAPKDDDAKEQETSKELDFNHDAELHINHDASH